MKHLVCCVIFLAMFVYAAYAEGTACSCSGTKTVKDSFQSADLVFMAKIQGFSFSLTSTSKIQIVVEKSWKGGVSPGKILSVQLINPGTACIQEKMEWANYQYWVVYVRATDGNLETAVCDGTKPAHYAEQEMKILNSLVF